MKTAHTQGEWKAIGLEIRHKNRGLILANVYSHLPINQSREEAEANAQLIAHAPELLQMVYNLKQCIKRLIEDDITQEERDKEAQWEGEAHELLYKINPNYYYNANAQPTIIEEEDIDNWNRWKSMELKEGASIEVSERIYYEMLGAVPPHIQDGNYFEVGEAHHHTNEGKAIHQAFWIHKGRYYSGFPKS
jgi:hypothetical protein